jgi:hypothetical protein
MKKLYNFQEKEDNRYAINKIRELQIAVIIVLVLLAIQFEFGMAVNLSNLPSLAPVGFSFPNILSALDQAGIVAVVHAVLGTVLTVISLISLLMALASKVRNVRVFGTLGFLSIALAEICGVLFVLSGFQNDNYSHGMATNFILTFAFYFIELYFLKPASNTKAS